MQKDFRITNLWLSNSNLPAWEKLPAKADAWSYDMEAHAKEYVERNCVLTNKKTEHLYKVCTPCLDDHHIQKEELETVGELSKVYFHIVLEQNR